MSLVLETQHLSKRFVLRHNAGDVKVRALGLLEPWRRRGGEEFWALRVASRCEIAGANRSAWSAATDRARARS